MIQYETHMLLGWAATTTIMLYSTPINYIEGVLERWLKKKKIIVF